MEAFNLADLYRTPLLEWSRIESALDVGLTQAPGSGGPDRHTCWLATINADGSPHLTGVGALWVDGAFWFETGEGTRKGRNLARDPRCSLSVAADDFDLVVEGDATMVTDGPTVAAMAARWAAGGWPVRVDDAGTALTADFSAPSAGPPPWRVYRMTVRARPRSSPSNRVAPPAGDRWDRPVAARPRRARLEDVHELAAALPHVTVEHAGARTNPVYQVGGKSFVFFRNPRPDATDPDTGERYDDVIVFWVPSESDKRALVEDPTSPFFTTPHFDGHPSVLLRGSHIGELTREELAEVVQDAWLARASARRAAVWLQAHEAEFGGGPDRRR